MRSTWRAPSTLSRSFVGDSLLMNIPSFTSSTSASSPSSSPSLWSMSSATSASAVAVTLEQARLFHSSSSRRPPRFSHNQSSNNNRGSGDLSGLNDEYDNDDMNINDLVLDDDDVAAKALAAWNNRAERPRRASVGGPSDSSGAGKRSTTSRYRPRTEPLADTMFLEGSDAAEGFERAPLAAQAALGGSGNNANSKAARPNNLMFVGDGEFLTSLRHPLSLFPLQAENSEIPLNNCALVQRAAAVELTLNKNLSVIYRAVLEHKLTVEIPLERFTTREDFYFMTPQTAGTLARVGYELLEAGAKRAAGVNTLDFSEMEKEIEEAKKFEAEHEALLRESERRHQELFGQELPSTSAAASTGEEKDVNNNNNDVDSSNRNGNNNNVTSETEQNKNQVENRGQDKPEAEEESKKNDQDIDEAHDDEDSTVDKATILKRFQQRVLAQKQKDLREELRKQQQLVEKRRKAMEKLQGFAGSANFVLPSLSDAGLYLALLACADRGPLYLFAATSFLLGPRSMNPNDRHNSIAVISRYPERSILFSRMTSETIVSPLCATKILPRYPGDFLSFHAVCLAHMYLNAKAHAANADGDESISVVGATAAAGEAVDSKDAVAHACAQVDFKNVDTDSHVVRNPNSKYAARQRTFVYNAMDRAIANFFSFSLHDFGEFANPAAVENFHDNMKHATEVSRKLAAESRRETAVSATKHNVNHKLKPKSKYDKSANNNNNDEDDDEDDEDASPSVGGWTKMPRATENFNSASTTVDDGNGGSTSTSSSSSSTATSSSTIVNADCTALGVIPPPPKPVPLNPTPEKVDFNNNRNQLWKYLLFIVRALPTMFLNSTSLTCIGNWNLNFVSQLERYRGETAGSSFSDRHSPQGAESGRMNYTSKYSKDYANSQSSKDQYTPHSFILENLVPNHPLANLFVDIFRQAKHWQLNQQQRELFDILLADTLHFIYCQRKVLSRVKSYNIKPEVYLYLSTLEPLLNMKKVDLYPPNSSISLEPVAGFVSKKQAQPAAVGEGSASLEGGAGGEDSTANRYDAIAGLPFYNKLPKNKAADRKPVDAFRTEEEEIDPEKFETAAFAVTSKSFVLFDHIHTTKSHLHMLDRFKNYNTQDMVMALRYTEDGDQQLREYFVHVTDITLTRLNHEAALYFALKRDADLRQVRRRLQYGARLAKAVFRKSIYAVDILRARVLSIWCNLMELDPVGASRCVRGDDMTVLITQVQLLKAAAQTVKNSSATEHAAVSSSSSSSFADQSNPANKNKGMSPNKNGQLDSSSSLSLTSTLQQQQQSTSTFSSRCGRQASVEQYFIADGRVGADATTLANVNPESSAATVVDQVAVANHFYTFLRVLASGHWRLAVCEAGKEPETHLRTERCVDPASFCELTTHFSRISMMFNHIEQASRPPKFAQNAIRPIITIQSVTAFQPIVQKATDDLIRAVKTMKSAAERIRDKAREELIASAATAAASSSAADNKNSSSATNATTKTLTPLTLEEFDAIFNKPDVSILAVQEFDKIPALRQLYCKYWLIHDNYYYVSPQELKENPEACRAAIEKMKYIEVRLENGETVVREKTAIGPANLYGVVKESWFRATQALIRLCSTAGLQIGYPSTREQFRAVNYRLVEGPLALLSSVLLPECIKIDITSGIFLISDTIVSLTHLIRQLRVRENNSSISSTTWQTYAVEVKKLHLLQMRSLAEAFKFIDEEVGKACDEELKQLLFANHEGNNSNNNNSNNDSNNNGKTSSTSVRADDVSSANGNGETHQQQLQSQQQPTSTGFSFDDHWGSIDDTKRRFSQGSVLPITSNMIPGATIGSTSASGVATRNIQSQQHVMQLRAAQNEERLRRYLSSKSKADKKLKDRAASLSPEDRSEANRRLETIWNEHLLAGPAEGSNAGVVSFPAPDDGQADAASSSLSNITSSPLLAAWKQFHHPDVGRRVQSFKRRSVDRTLRTIFRNQSVLGAPSDQLVALTRTYAFLILTVNRELQKRVTNGAPDSRTILLTADTALYCHSPAAPELRLAIVADLTRLLDLSVILNHIKSKRKPETLYDPNYEGSSTHALERIFGSVLGDATEDVELQDHFVNTLTNLVPTRNHLNRILDLTDSLGERFLVLFNSVMEALCAFPLEALVAVDARITRINEHLRSLEFSEEGNAKNEKKDWKPIWTKNVSEEVNKATRFAPIPHVMPRILNFMENCFSVLLISLLQSADVKARTQLLCKFARKTDLYVHDVEFNEDAFVRKYYHLHHQNQNQNQNQIHKQQQHQQHSIRIPQHLIDSQKERIENSNLAKLDVITTFLSSIVNALSVFSLKPSDPAAAAKLRTYHITQHKMEQLFRILCETATNEIRLFRKYPDASRSVLSLLKQLKDVRGANNTNSVGGDDDNSNNNSMKNSNNSSQGDNNSISNSSGLADIAENLMDLLEGAIEDFESGRGVGLSALSANIPSVRANNQLQQLQQQIESPRPSTAEQQLEEGREHQGQENTAAAAGAASAGAATTSSTSASTLATIAEVPQQAQHKDAMATLLQRVQSLIDRGASTSRFQLWQQELDDGLLHQCSTLFSHCQDADSRAQLTSDEQLCAIEESTPLFQVLLKKQNRSFLALCANDSPSPSHNLVKIAMAAMSTSGELMTKFTTVSTSPFAQYKTAATGTKPYRSSQHQHPQHQARYSRDHNANSPSSTSTSSPVETSTSSSSSSSSLQQLLRGEMENIQTLSNMLRNMEVIVAASCPARVMFEFRATSYLEHVAKTMFYCLEISHHIIHNSNSKNRKNNRNINNNNNVNINDQASSPSASSSSSSSSTSSTSSSLDELEQQLQQIAYEGAWAAASIFRKILVYFPGAIMKLFDAATAPSSSSSSSSTSSSNSANSNKIYLLDFSITYYLYNDKPFINTEQAIAVPPGIHPLAAVGATGGMLSQRTDIYGAYASAAARESKKTFLVARLLLTPMTQLMVILEACTTNLRDCPRGRHTITDALSLMESMIVGQNNLSRFCASTVAEITRLVLGQEAKVRYSNTSSSAASATATLLAAAVAGSSAMASSNTSAAAAASGMSGSSNSLSIWDEDQDDDAPATISSSLVSASGDSNNNNNVQKKNPKNLFDDDNDDDDNVNQQSNKSSSLSNRSLPSTQQEKEAAIERLLKRVRREYCYEPDDKLSARLGAYGLCEIVGPQHQQQQQQQQQQNAKLHRESPSVALTSSTFTSTSPIHVNAFDVFRLVGLLYATSQQSKVPALCSKFGAALHTQGPESDWEIRQFKAVLNYSPEQVDKLEKQQRDIVAKVVDNAISLDGRVDVSVTQQLNALTSLLRETKPYTLARVIREYQLAEPEKAEHDEAQEQAEQAPKQGEASSSSNNKANESGSARTSRNNASAPVASFHSSLIEYLGDAETASAAETLVTIFALFDVIDHVDAKTRNFSSRSYLIYAKTLLMSAAEPRRFNDIKRLEKLLPLCDFRFKKFSNASGIASANQARVKFSDKLTSRAAELVKKI